MSHCCDYPCSWQGDTISCLLLQPLRLVEGPLIQQVIIFTVSRKFCCAMKARSYDHRNNFKQGFDCHLPHSTLELLSFYVMLLDCSCMNMYSRSHWQEIECEQIHVHVCLGFSLLCFSPTLARLLCCSIGNTLPK